MPTLKNQVIHGLKWSFMAKFLTQVFSWVSTFMVIRILSPNDYGIVAIAMVFFTFILMFTNNGLVSALVRNKNVDKGPSSQIFTLSLVINLIASVGLFLFADTLASWYENPALGDVLKIIALCNPINSFIVVPQAKMQLSMQFKRKSIIEGAAGGVGAVSALVLALAGFEYWSLIISNILIVLTKAVFFNLYTKTEYGFTTRWKEGIALFKFAMHVQLGGFIWFVYNKADMIIVGRMLGLEKAGVYNVACDVASMPMAKINSVMNEVAFSAFSKSSDDKDAAANYLTKALRLMGAIAFPIFYGISAVSHEMVSVVLGEKWIASAPIISILCLILPFRMLNSVMANYAIGMGETQFGVSNAMITALVVIASISIGAQFGLEGVAIGWAIGFLLVYIVLIQRYKKKFTLVSAQLMSYHKIILPSLLMLVAVYFLPVSDLPVIVALLVKMMIGAIVIVPALIGYYGKEFKSLFAK